jgi:hypothetical protein
MLKTNIYYSIIKEYKNARNEHNRKSMPDVY